MSKIDIRPDNCQTDAHHLQECRLHMDEKKIRKRIINILRTADKHMMNIKIFRSALSENLHVHHVCMSAVLRILILLPTRQKRVTGHLMGSEKQM